MMGYNPVDEKIQDVVVIHAGTYVGGILDGKSLTLKAADIANIKGGLVATITASNEFGIFDGTGNASPVGIFLGDGSRPNEVSVLMRGGLYEIYNNWNTAATLSDFAPGTELVATATGKLTPRGASTKRVVATVTKRPASVTDSLGIKLEL